MTDIHDEFRAAAHIYSDRLKAEKEARDNPDKTRRDNADAFAGHAEALLAQQSNNNII